MEEDFITQCLSGEAQPSEIHFFIKKWRYLHENKTDLSLRKYLGMTEDEYSRWVDDPSAIYEILNERQ
jgi:hypothetical protein